jgi:hypothetical protein
MLRIAVELALHEPLYEEFVSKFFQHKIWIAGAMDRMGRNTDDMWDYDDGFFYDVLRFPDGSSQRLKVRSMVGLLPLAAVAVFEEDILDRLPNFHVLATEFLARHPELAVNIHMPAEKGVNGRRMLSIVNEDKLRKILAKMLDENEFFSPYGIRSLSRYHQDHPFVFHHGGHESRVDYVAGDSNSAMFGGNSNWRGPVWMPVNFLLLMSLLRLYSYYGDDFTVECPTGSGCYLTLLEVGQELSERLTCLFLQQPETGARPANGNMEKFRTDPHWRDLILFHEYFNGDNGAGIGANHQTGWTGCIAGIIQMMELIDKELLLDPDVENVIMKVLAGKS